MVLRSPEQPIGATPVVGEREEELRTGLVAKGRQPL